MKRGLRDLGRQKHLNDCLTVIKCLNQSRTVSVRKYRGDTVRL
ncbi:MAG: hypothetical protein ABSA26_13720 [Thermoguttaceae bacterium]